MRTGGAAALLAILPEWTLVGGKGGVGKTTCAAALAIESARHGARTLLLTTDPARSLGDALGVELTHEPREVPACPGLEAFQLDAARARDAFLARWRDVLITIVDRGTYLDTEDIAGLIDAALPGADEAMALLTLADLGHEGRWERILIDTAPTGHTLRLLSLPATFRALVDLLEAMQGKHRFMVSALTHRYRADAADAFLDQMRERLDRLASALHDGSRAAALLVTRAEPVVAAETLRYLDALPSLGIACAAIVVNAVDDAPDQERLDALHEIAREARSRGLPVAMVPTLHEPPMGKDGVRAWAEAVHVVNAEDLLAESEEPQGNRGERSNAELLDLPRADLRARPLTIVGGKGGVGKTTVACALAIRSATPDAPVLVVSTDPAPSIGDALGQEVADAETEVAGAPGLYARQMDAGAAFARMREAWQARIDAVFDALVERGVDAAHDRRIVRELFALAPPGIDELYALATLGETLEENRHAALVVDPAPTGHLLRLLEMPELALDWSHRLMRLMLNYREVLSLGEAAEELLAFARRTRALRALLGDGARAGLLVVSLDEPLVRAETSRLVEAARAHGVDVMGIMWNRASRTPSPLPDAGPGRQFVGEALAPSPRGVSALREWSAGWRLLPGDDG